MVSGSLARRYARAIVGIGVEQHNLDQIGADLRTLAGALKTSPELVTVLNNPSINKTDRRKVLDALLTRISAQPATRNLIYLMLDGERMAVVPALSREVDAMIEARGGRVSAEVTSAKPLSPIQLTQITTALEKLSGKKVDVVKREDASLLGGVVAKVGDVVYDGSLRTQLRTLRDELTK